LTEGKSKTISTSKIRKITAKRKNRREKGKRAVPIGSNPHSNGDLFSRSEKVRLASTQAKKKTTDVIKRAEKADKSVPSIGEGGNPHNLHHHRTPFVPAHHPKQVNNLQLPN
jgi:hypothetical protein